LKKVGNGNILINITLKDGYELVGLNGRKEEYV
jgi:hypothetical protein